MEPLPQPVGPAADSLEWVRRSDWEWHSYACYEGDERVSPRWEVCRNGGGQWVPSVDGATLHMFARPTDEAAKGVAQLLENIRQALVKGTLDELLGTQVHEGAECRLVRESDGALWFEIDPDKIQLLVEFAREQFQRFLVVGADGGAQNERLVEKLLATPPDLEKAIRQIKNRKKFFENTRDSVMSEDHQKRDATVGVGQLDWVLRVLDGDGRTDVGKANAAILANQTSAENNG